VTATTPPAIDRDAVDALALARWAALCEAADERDARMGWGRVAPLDDDAGDAPAAEGR